MQLRYLLILALILLPLFPASSQSFSESQVAECHNLRVQLRKQILGIRKRINNLPNNKNLSSTQRQLRQNRLARVRRIVRRSMLRVRNSCISGQMAAFPVSGQAPFSIHASTPSSPVDFSELTPDLDGKYQLVLHGSKFMARGMVLKVASANTGQESFLSYNFINRQTLTVSLDGPFSDTLTFTLLRHRPKGKTYVASNSLEVLFTEEQEDLTSEPDDESDDISDGDEPNNEEEPGDNSPDQPEGDDPALDMPGFDPGALVPGAHIATLSHEAPAVAVGAEYIISGIVPLPVLMAESAFSQGKSLVAVSQDEQVLPAQMSIASMTASGVDSIQVTARVKNLPVNGRNSVDVVLADYQMLAKPAAQQHIRDLVLNHPTIHPSIKALFLDSSRLVVTSKDVFGNEYQCSLTENTSGNAKIISYGPLKTVVRTFCVMTHNPAKGNFGNVLPRFLGVHAYFTFYDAEQAFGLDLRFGNSLSGRTLNNGDVRATAMRELPYDSLKIIARANVVTRYNARLAATGNRTYDGTSTTIRLVDHDPNGKVRFIGFGRERQQHLAIGLNNPSGQVTAEHIAELRDVAFATAGESQNGGFELFSPFNPAIGGLGLMKGKHWPSLPGNIVEQLRTEQQNRFSTYHQAYQTGVCANYTWNPNGASLGMVKPDGCPHGVSYQGMTGGDDLDYSGAYTCSQSQSNACVRTAALLFRGTEIRHRFLTQLNGEPTTIADALQSSFQAGNNTFQGQHLPLVVSNIAPVVNIYDKNNPSNMKYWGDIVTKVGQNEVDVSLSKAHFDYAQAQGLLADSSTVIENFGTHDWQHALRRENHNSRLLTLTNDPMAKDYAVHSLWFALKSAGYYPIWYNTFQNQGWQHAPGSWKEMIPATPGIGVNVGRDVGHKIAAISNGLSATSDPQAYQEARNALQLLVNDVMKPAQTEAGFVMKGYNKGKMGPLFVSRTNEQSFIARALFSAMRRSEASSNSETSQNANQIILGMARAAASPLGWNSSANCNSTRWDVPLGRIDDPTKIFTTWAEVQQAMEEICANEPAGYYYCQHNLQYYQNSCKGSDEWLGTAVTSLYVGVEATVIDKIKKYLANTNNYGSLTLPQAANNLIHDNQLKNGGPQAALAALCQVGLCDGL
jgi:hypothetical protein